MVDRLYMALTLQQVLTQAVSHERISVASPTDSATLSRSCFGKLEETHVKIHEYLQRCMK